MKNAFVISSLNGIEYVYNYKYNVLQPKTIYRENVIEEIAKKYYEFPKPINRSDYLLQSTQEKHRCLNLVLTDNCNFRCNYCANSEMYLFSKGYNKKAMSNEVIEKAVSLYITNYRKQIQVDPNLKFIIMFYGGEPLLEFDKIKYTVELVAKNQDILPVYTITTNGSLVTGEMLSFFKENNFLINVSMDGYKEIHDLNRRTKDGKDTFHKVVENYYKLHDFLGKDSVGVITTFDTQVSPMKLYEFYSSNPKIDQGLKRVAAVGTINTSYYNNIVPYSNYQEELYELYRMIKSGDPTCFLQQLYNNKFVKMYSRKEYYDKTYAICSPISAKLTVSVDGNLHICEKINENYPIGNVESGLNKNIAYDYYEQLINLRKNKCANCEIRNLCEPCFAMIHRGGDSFQIMEEECKANKLGVISMLENYCTFLDRGNWPDKFDTTVNNGLRDKLL